MNKIDWKRKLSSRKLWAAVAGIITGLAMVFGLDESIISTVAGAVVSATSIVAYIMGEAKADAAGATNGMFEALKEVIKPSVNLTEANYGIANPDIGGRNNGNC